MRPLTSVPVFLFFVKQHSHPVKEFDCYLPCEFVEINSCYRSSLHIFFPYETIYPDCVCWSSHGYPCHRNWCDLFWWNRMEVMWCCPVQLHCGLQVVPSKRNVCDSRRRKTNTPRQSLDQSYSTNDTSVHLIHIYMNALWINLNAFSIPHCGLRPFQRVVFYFDGHLRHLSQKHNSVILWINYHSTNECICIMSSKSRFYCLSFDIYWNHLPWVL